jgi:hypothetical protein
MLTVHPLTLEQANAFIAHVHRHHQPVVGHRFSLGAFKNGECVGVAVVGRAVARMVDQNGVAEVTRLATDGTKNACSILYAACARACDAMGYAHIQTYTLPSEGGASLRASGWTLIGEAGGGDWNRPNQPLRGKNRTDQPMERKQKWTKILTNGKNGSQTPQMLTLTEIAEQRKGQNVLDLGGAA